MKSLDYPNLILLKFLKFLLYKAISQTLYYRLIYFNKFNFNGQKNSYFIWVSDCYSNTGEGKLAINFIRSYHI